MAAGGASAASFMASSVISVFILEVDAGGGVRFQALLLLMAPDGRLVDVALDAYPADAVLIQLVHLQAYDAGTFSGWFHHRLPVPGDELAYERRCWPLPSEVEPTVVDVQNSLRLVAGDEDAFGELVLDEPRLDGGFTSRVIGRKLFCTS